MNNRLYVGNLAFHTTEDTLLQTFSVAGTVSEAKLVIDRETGRSRGFAFVSMSTDAEAQAAIDQLNGADLDGRALRVNIAGFFHVTQRVVPQMLAQGRGHIVQITTTLVDQPIAGAPSGLAGLTKGGLAAVTRGLAIEYADRGIRVNAVAPGIIRTPMHAPDALAALAQLHPMGRLGEVGEVVEAILYLERAGFVTGEILNVDGGQHAGRW